MANAVSGRGAGRVVALDVPSYGRRSFVLQDDATMQCAVIDPWGAEVVEAVRDAQRAERVHELVAVIRTWDGDSLPLIANEGVRAILASFPGTVLFEPHEVGEVGALSLQRIGGALLVTDGPAPARSDDAHPWLFAGGLIEPAGIGQALLGSRCSNQSRLTLLGALRAAFMAAPNSRVCFSRETDRDHVLANLALAQLLEPSNESVGNRITVLEGRPAIITSSAGLTAQDELQTNLWLRLDDADLIGSVCLLASASLARDVDASDPVDVLDALCDLHQALLAHASGSLTVQSR